MKDEFDNDTGELLTNPEIDGGEERLIVPFVRSAYNYDRDMVSQQTSLFCDDPSLAQQHMAEDADINVIVKRFGITGQLPQGVRLPEYGDFTGVHDYRSALEAVQAAEEDFSALPADLRAKFDNNPQLYLDFVENPSNKEQLYELGLAERVAPPPPPADAPKAQTEGDA